MKLTEKILWGLCILGLILNVSLVPGGAILTVFSFALLSCFYFYFGFAFLNGIRLRHTFKKSSWKGISTLRILSAIFSGFAISSSLIGLLYYFLFWPGAKVMLLSGLFFMGITLIVGSIKNNKTIFYKRILTRIIVFTAVTFIFYLIPKERLLEFKYRNHPSYVEAMKNVWKNPYDIEARKQLDEEKMKLILSNHN